METKRKTNRLTDRRAEDPAKAALLDRWKSIEAASNTRDVSEWVREWASAVFAWKGLGVRGYEPLGLTPELIREVEKQGYVSEAFSWWNTARNASSREEAQQAIDSMKAWLALAGKTHDYLEVTRRQIDTLLRSTSVSDPANRALEFGNQPSGNTVRDLSDRV